MGERAQTRLNCMERKKKEYTALIDYERKRKRNGCIVTVILLIRFHLFRLYDISKNAVFTLQ